MRIDDEEAQAVARSKEWFKSNQGTPLKDVAAELGFTMEQIRNSAHGSFFSNTG